jgi:hypothetical protein
MDTAPMGYTRARPTSAARFMMNSVTEAWSFTGSVFGMQATAVKPPATAEAVPVAIGLLVFLPGFAQVDVNVDQAGRDHARLRKLDDSRVAHRQVPADARHLPAFNQNVEPSVAARNRIDDVDVFQSIERIFTSRPLGFFAARQQVQHGHPHATPLATCSRMTDHRPSATAESISTPRFMGPGA